MLLYPIYKAIKTRLGADVPVFFFIGQYLPGRQNTSYKVPAIYIEMPKDLPINFYPKKLMTAKGKIKIHYISYAPFKNHDNDTQDAAVLTHDSKLNDIDKLISGWNATDENGNKITEQFTQDNADLLNYQDMALVSVLTYNVEIYSRHLMTETTIVKG
jgi:hypothetical protein